MIATHRTNHRSYIYIPGCSNHGNLYLLDTCPVKETTEYLDDVVTEWEKGGGGEVRRTEGGVGGIPVGARERGERTGRSILGDFWQEEGRADKRGKYWFR